MKWKTFSKLISRVTTTLLFIVLLLSLFLAVSSRASGGDPSLFGYQLKTVLSGSMEPGIKTGSVIAIKSGGDMTRFKKDDVIIFETKEDILVTHRIIEVTEGGQQYITKGDSNDAADLDPVQSKNVVGMYVGFTIPFVGYIMNFVNSKEGVALLLILPGVLLIIYSVVTLWRVARQIEKLKVKVNESIE